MDAHGRLPVHLAAEGDHWEAVMPLLEAVPEGAATQDGMGRVPLHWAASNLDWRSMAFVLEAASRLDAAGKARALGAATGTSGDTPLHWLAASAAAADEEGLEAVEGGFVKLQMMVGKLVAAGARADVPNLAGVTALGTLEGLGGAHLASLRATLTPAAASAELAAAVAPIATTAAGLPQARRLGAKKGAKKMTVNIRKK